MGKSEVLRWVFWPPHYVEDIDASRWRQASVMRAIVLALCLLFNVLMYARLAGNSVFNEPLAAALLPILIASVFLDLLLSLAMFRFAWARSLRLMYFIVAVEVTGNMVLIQGTGSLHSNAIIMTIGMIAFYRTYFGWRLGLWTMVWALVPHATMVLLELNGNLRTMSWFLTVPLGQYSIDSMRLANLIAIAGAYVVTFFGSNAVSNLLREKDRALALARREAAKIADDVRHGRLTGTVLDGEYALGELLGRGGMGEIYAAGRVVDDSRVAVKVLHQFLANEDTMLQRFEREAQLASRLDGNCTAEIYAIGYDPDRDLHYIAMEYLRGEDLFAFLRRHEYLDIDDVLELGRGIARVLDEAHTAGVVHRDLKPQNVFLLRDSSEFEIRLLDFGIARLVEPLPGSTLTIAAEVIGTPGYMPPEQAVGDHALIGPATDRFAFGAILYRALTGRLPFEAKQIRDYINVVTNERPTAASSLRDDIPRAVDAVFERALAKDPKDRFQSSMQLIRALEAAYETTPVRRQLGLAATMPGSAVG